VVDPSRPAPEHVNPDALRRTRAELLRQVAGLDLLLNADRDVLLRTRDDLWRAAEAIDGLLATNRDAGSLSDQPGPRRFRPDDASHSTLM
jgi:hypothetical protein